MKLDTNKGAWLFVALIGLLLMAGGLFGVWLQGRFYEGGFPTAATIGEVRDAFTWPTAFTSAGSLILAAVILVSPLTVTWSVKRRLSVLGLFALFVLVACFIAGHFAAGHVAKILN